MKRVSKRGPKFKEPDADIMRALARYEQRHGGITSLAAALKAMGVIANDKTIQPESFLRRIRRQWDRCGSAYRAELARSEARPVTLGDMMCREGLPVMSMISVTPYADIMRRVNEANAMMDAMVVRLTGGRAEQLMRAMGMQYAGMDQQVLRVMGGPLLMSRK